MKEGGEGGEREPGRWGMGRDGAREVGNVGEVEKWGRERLALEGNGREGGEEGVMERW